MDDLHWLHDILFLIHMYTLKTETGANSVPLMVFAIIIPLRVLINTSSGILSQGYGLVPYEKLNTLEKENTSKGI